MERAIFHLNDAQMQMAFITRALIWLLLSLATLAAMYHHQQPYDDSTLSITSTGTPDPFVSLFRGQYYMTFTTGDRIEIWSSSNLADIERTSVKHRIWTPPHGSNHSADLWAPELHALRGRWYVYYAAASPEQGNKSHRMYVLGGSAATQDPCSGPWEFLGGIRGMPDQWAIDGTVFELDDELYFAYSGWPHDDNGSGRDQDQSQPDHRGHLTNGCSKQHQHKLSHGNSSSKQQEAHRSDKDVNNDKGNNTMVTPATTTTTKSKDDLGLVQHLFLVRLEDPTTAGSKPVAISQPTQPWETTHDAKGAHAINEGPQWLASPDGQWRGLAYSCAGSWTHEYKMATLEYVGGGAPVLSPSSWRKSEAPLLQTQTQTGNRCSADEGGGPFGPGHGSFLHVGNGNVVAIYHATDSPSDGWANRRARAQRVAFTDKGPYMGSVSGIEGTTKRGIMARVRAKLARGEKRTPNGKEALRALLDGRDMHTCVGEKATRQK